jgi:nicotinate-nucleotide--dimethylbenzimidazole phosphoribosyltransferase
MSSKAALLKEIIDGRHSARHFSNKTVPAGLIREVIEAGRMAPSPTNTQPWYFLVISGEEKRELSKLVAVETKTIQLEGFRNISLDAVRIIEEAPHIISVWNMKRLSKRLKKIKGLIGPRYYRNYERAERDAIACAIENMWLTASALGLGMVWIMAGLGTVNRYKKKFGIDGEIVAHLALGYASPVHPEERTVRKPLEEISGFFKKT